MSTFPASRTDSTAWRPTASLEILKLRARLLGRIRDWFAERGVLEVETPALSRFAATDPNIESLEVAGGGWLHTSPEFPMKRLLAAGCEDIYQFARVFRKGESGRRHNPEFTLLEWYRVGMGYQDLMDDVLDLCIAAGAGLRDWKTPRKLTYAQAMASVGVDSGRDSSPELAARLDAAGVDWPRSVKDDREALLDLILSTLVEPSFDPAQPTLVYDFPPAQAALATIRPDPDPVAERFELFLGGMELANGFRELTNASEQRQRFEQDCRRRAERGQPDIPADEFLLAALEHGLPACSGVALGFDRLVMVISGAPDLASALAFPSGRA